MTSRLLDDFTPPQVGGLISEETKLAGRSIHFAGPVGQRADRGRENVDAPPQTASQLRSKAIIGRMHKHVGMMPIFDPTCDHIAPLIEPWDTGFNFIACHESEKRSRAGYRCTQRRSWLTRLRTFFGGIARRSRIQGPAVEQATIHAEPRKQFIKGALVAIVIEPRPMTWFDRQGKISRPVHEELPERRHLCRRKGGRKLQEGWPKPLGISQNLEDTMEGGQTRRTLRLPQSAVVADDPRYLAAKVKTVRRRGGPLRHTINARHSVERGVDFDCLKDAPILGEPVRSPRISRVQLALPIGARPHRTSHMEGRSDTEVSIWWHDCGPSLERRGTGRNDVCVRSYGTNTNSFMFTSA